MSSTAFGEICGKLIYYGPSCTKVCRYFDLHISIVAFDPVFQNLSRQCANRADKWNTTVVPALISATIFMDFRDYTWYSGTSVISFTERYHGPGAFPVLKILHIRSLTVILRSNLGDVIFPLSPLYMVRYSALFLARSSLEYYSQSLFLFYCYPVVVL